MILATRLGSLQTSSHRANLRRDLKGVGLLTPQLPTSDQDGKVLAQPVAEIQAAQAGVSTILHHRCEMRAWMDGEYMPHLPVMLCLQ